MVEITCQLRRGNLTNISSEQGKLNTLNLDMLKSVESKKMLKFLSYPVYRFFLNRINLIEINIA